MAEQYAPTTDAIRFAAAIGMRDHRAHIIQPDDEGGAAFDAWLAAHDARVLRDAAEELRGDDHGDHIYPADIDAIAARIEGGTPT